MGSYNVWRFVFGFFHVTMFLRYIYVVACLITLFLLGGLVLARKYSIVCHHNLFIHPSVAEYLSSFHLLVIVNKAGVNMRLHVFVWVPVFNAFDIYVGVELPNHVVILTFEGLPDCFPPWLYRFTFPRAHTLSHFAYDTNLMRSGYFINEDPEI